MTLPRSAGVLLHRFVEQRLEILLVHPGGPFWRNKDVGAWQLPKGQIEPGENEEAAARREVHEELGIELPGALVPLGQIVQARGKIVIAFTIDRNFDPGSIVSNTVEIEWPARSGRRLTVPEIDKARWFTIDEGRRYILPSQTPLIDRLLEVLGPAVLRPQAPRLRGG